MTHSAGARTTTGLPAGVTAGLAAAWAGFFSVVHLYWLVGGRLALPDGLAITDNLPLLIIDIVAVPMLAVAAWIVLRPLAASATRRHRRRMHLLTWVIGAVLVVHALPSVPTWAELALTERTAADLDAFEWFATCVYEPWFMLGGVLFLAAAWTARAVRPPGP